MISPDSIRIEASSICQLKCESCNLQKGKIEDVIGKGFLKYLDFIKIIDGYRLKSIELSHHGEIFLNPQINNIIKESHDRKIMLTAYNGVNLNDLSSELLEYIVKYKFSGMLCSIDGASNETYSIYRKNGSFEKVISNIKKINELKIKFQTNYPELIWQFIVFGHNEHEIPLARKLATEMNMKFVTKMSWDESFSPIKNKEYVLKETGWKAATRTEILKVTHQDYARNCCLQMWKQPQINWDGRLLGCCINSWQDYGVNVLDLGLHGALNSEKAAKARDMLMGIADDDDSIPCSRCSKYKEMKKSNSWITSDEINSYKIRR